MSTKNYQVHHKHNTKSYSFLIFIMSGYDNEFIDSHTRLLNHKN